MLWACQSVPEPAPYRFASRCARRPVARRSSRALCAVPVCVENPDAAACAGRFLRRRPCSARPCRPCTPNSPTPPSSSTDSAKSAPEAELPLADESKGAGEGAATGPLPDRAAPTAPALLEAELRDREDPRARLRRVAAQVQLLDSLNDWHAYDALAVEAATGTALEATVVQAGRLMGASGWGKRGGALQTDEATVQAYVRKVAAGYAAHAYHNSVHAAEVAFVVQYWLRHCPKLACSPLQQAALLLAAAVHDVGHRALTNDFLVQAGDPLAIRYNDRSVQEQFHAATAFELMRGADVFGGLGAEDRKEARALMVESVLATDMALHAQLLKEVEAADAGPVGAVDPRLLQKLVLHAADLGHPLRPWRVHAAWSRRMMGEFFAQGDLDKQRGRAVLPMFDRDQCNAGSSQVGFINFVVAPTFNLLSRFLPRRLSRDHSDVLAQNTREWKALADDEKRCAEFTAGIPVRARDEAQATGLA